MTIEEQTEKQQKLGNLKRRIESLLIVAQINAIRTNYIQAKINNMQQNNKSWLCGDKEEAINHILSECNKLEEKECKTRHNWVGKVIHMELCKKLNVDNTSKWYRHKRESV